ncbi:protein shisa-4 [Alligator mississippiensis]|uniref:Protein shisa-4 n=1 Tax=Alligator mississippiensis TaxID=8496 RepID=A0A151N8V4_ALLMI|nr:protein shisa-4 [Alligator mississippiensis]
MGAGAGAARAAWPVAGMVLCSLAASLVSADEDCLWYLDKNGSWHRGFDCEFSFCCGNCYHRYCCIDPMRLITERQQKHCLAFSPKTIAGIASAVVLFIAIVTTIVCCFMCSCCYLYQRRQHMRTPFQGQEIPLSSYPAQPPPPLHIIRCIQQAPHSTTHQHLLPTSLHSQCTLEPEETRERLEILYQLFHAFVQDQC